MTEPSEGVYLVEEGGRLHRVHTYIGGDYGLEEVAAILRLGRREDPGEGYAVGLRLTGAELAELKVFADYYSFDFEEGFIEMCRDMTEWSAGAGSGELRFVADF